MMKVFYIFLLIILIQSCVKKVEEHSLINKYHFNADRSDVLDIYSNHTFSHRFQSEKGQLFECHGKWRYSGDEIFFDDFCFFNKSGFAAGSGTWIALVKDRDSEIRIIYSDDGDGDLYFANN